MTWNEYIKTNRNRVELTVTVLFLIISLVSLANFLNFIEARPGIVLPDPVLELFNPVDLTWLTFGLIYFSLLFAVYSLIKKPLQLIFAFQLYTIMVIIRMTAMYLLPLEPPENMILLSDPVVEYFGTGRALTKDLFFSGHTATLFVLYLVSENKQAKHIFLVCTAMVALSVLLQHVHYTIDIFAAVFFTYSAFAFLKYLRRNVKQILFT
ncbi:MAG: phosphatase PAP2-related protein [Ignavibacteriaceae bacterium]